MSRPSHAVEANGRPVSRVWTPDAPRVEIASRVPTGKANGGGQVQASPRMRLGSTRDHVVLLVEIGPAAIPFALTPDQADEFAAKVVAEAEKVRALQCPSVSPVTGPDDSPAPAGTASTTASSETPRPSGSTPPLSGSSSGDSSSGSTHCASDASSEGCSCPPTRCITVRNVATLPISP